MFDSQVIIAAHFADAKRLETSKSLVAGNLINAELGFVPFVGSAGLELNSFVAERELYDDLKSSADVVGAVDYQKMENLFQEEQKVDFSSKVYIQNLYPLAPEREILKVGLENEISYMCHFFHAAWYLLEPLPQWYKHENDCSSYLEQIA